VLVHKHHTSRVLVDNRVSAPRGPDSQARGLPSPMSAPVSALIQSRKSAAPLLTDPLNRGVPSDGHFRWVKPWVVFCSRFRAPA
jgi:hypothetical protein